MEFLRYTLTDFNSECSIPIICGDFDTPMSNSNSRIQAQFKTKKLKNWNKQDIFDWMQLFCSERQMDMNQINVNGFASTSGSKLMKMTPNQFLKIDSIYGEELYHALTPYRRLKLYGGGIISEQTTEISRSESPLYCYDQYPDDIFARSSSRNSDLLTIDTYDYSGNYSSNLPASPSRMMNNLCLDSPRENFSNDRLSPYPSYNYETQQNSLYSQQQPDIGGSSPNAYEYLSDECELNESFSTPTLAELTDADLNLLDRSNIDYQEMITPDWDLLGADSIPAAGPSSLGAANFLHTSQAFSTRSASALSHRPEVLMECGLAVSGRSRKKTGGCPKVRTESPIKKRSTNRVSIMRPNSKTGTVKKEKGKKVWEFLLDLLDNPDTNPKLIRWENKEQGVFRLIEHDLIAQKWGMRRDKSDLSYDYFARTMRYQYTTKMLESVPERKLVYKFGAEVMNRLREQGKV